MLRRGILTLCALLCSVSAFAQANGKLQIHYMDVGQGDGAVLISPLGEVVLFDDGVLNQCGKPIAYLQALGISKIDYHIASHYHSDHIGCAASIFQMFPLQKAAYDRGGSYTTTAYSAYVNAVGAKRLTAQKGQTITLDAASAAPVTITFLALNGNGVTTTDENDLSLVAVVRFGQFDAEFGGDLSGAGTGAADPDPAAPCVYSVSPTSQSVGAGASTFAVAVATSAACSWTASANASWLSIPTGTTSGGGSISVTVAANTGSARSGTVVVAGQALTVSQDAGATTPGGPNTCPKPAGAPANATAVCKDGYYSSSQNRSGTCSSHGGVSCWICPGTLCSGLMYSPLDIDMPASYADIESGVAALVGRIEVYKVHHHGSMSSSNVNWLSAVAPKVGIVSMSAANSYGHPTTAAMTRLHNAGVKTYWTSVGNGVAPVTGSDAVTTSGGIVVEVGSGASTFSVRYGAGTDIYPMWTTTAPAPAATPPFGSLDTPVSGTTATGEVGTTGWALDDSGVTGVDVYRSPVAGESVQANGLVFVGAATLVAGARPDIASAYPAYPGATSAGWGYMLLSNMLPNLGNGTFTISAFVRTGDGANTLLGSRSIVLANSTNTKPFGTIDTPTQGQTVSGTIVNFGWVLTPSPTCIPTDGSTIDVVIDNVAVGHPVYNNARADIASLFPGLCNSNNAVGYYTLDTTTLTNGVHTIAWVARNNAGGATGMGSRYFNVANQTSGIVQDAKR
jgi:beta-lactamase superfamily II metal-dependent hydrolase